MFEWLMCEVLEQNSYNDVDEAALVRPGRLTRPRCFWTNYLYEYEYTSTNPVSPYPSAIRVLGIREIRPETSLCSNLPIPLLASVSLRSAVIINPGDVDVCAKRFPVHDPRHQVQPRSLESEIQVPAPTIILPAAASCPLHIPHTAGQRGPLSRQKKKVLPPPSHKPSARTATTATNPAQHKGRNSKNGGHKDKAGQWPDKRDEKDGCKAG